MLGFSKSKTLGNDQSLNTYGVRVKITGSGSANDPIIVNPVVEDLLAVQWTLLLFAAVVDFDWSLMWNKRNSSLLVWFPVFDFRIECKVIEECISSISDYEWIERKVEVKNDRVYSHTTIINAKTNRRESYTFDHTAVFFVSSLATHTPHIKKTPAMEGDIDRALKLIEECYGRESVKTVIQGSLQNIVSRPNHASDLAIKLSQAASAGLNAVYNISVGKWFASIPVMQNARIPCYLHARKASVSGATHQNPLLIDTDDHLLAEILIKKNLYPICQQLRVADGGLITFIKRTRFKHNGVHILEETILPTTRTNRELSVFFDISRINEMYSHDSVDPPSQIHTISSSKCDAPAGILVYLSVDSVQKGPFTFPQIKEMWCRGNITADSYYWHEGMKNWEPITNLGI